MKISGLSLLGTKSAKEGFLYVLKNMNIQAGIRQTKFGGKE
jgi:hypothetical protein